MLGLLEVHLASAKCQSKKEVNSAMIETACSPSQRDEEREVDFMDIEAACSGKWMPDSAQCRAEGKGPPQLRDTPSACGSVHSPTIMRETQAALGFEDADTFKAESSRRKGILNFFPILS
jgi:hypothetical protein